MATTVMSEEKEQLLRKDPGGRGEFWDRYLNGNNSVPKQSDTDKPKESGRAAGTNGLKLGKSPKGKWKSPKGKSKSPKQSGKKGMLDSVSTDASGPSCPGVCGQGSVPMLPPDLVEEGNNISENVENITDGLILPFIFDYDQPDYISDGGEDMYDSGNAIQSELVNNDDPTTTIDPKIPYTGGEVVDSEELFGENSAYYTLELDGLFVLSVRNATVRAVWTAGELGADGSGYVRQNEYCITVAGFEYKVFTKFVFGAGDPSVLHFWIFPGDKKATHFVSDDTDDDIDYIIAGQGVGDFYYLLMASEFLFPDEGSVISVVTSFISAARGL